MKRALVLVALLAGCSIPGDRFFKPGDHTDGGNGDGSGSGSADAMIDAPPANVLRHGWIVDFQNGLFPVDKDPVTGALTVTGGTVGGGMPQSAVTNRQGTHLFVIDLQTIRDFTINNGTQLALSGSFPVNGCTNMRFGALHPSGSWLAVGCANNRFALASINAQGAIVSAQAIATSGTTVFVPAWTPNGNCLFFTDLNGAPGAQLLSFQFNTATGIATANGPAGGPPAPRGIAVTPNGLWAYVAGTGTPPEVQRFAVGQSACNLAYTDGLPGSPNGQVLTIDPLGRFLYETGSEVYAYRLAMDGSLAGVLGSPFLVGSPTMDGAIFDPAMPNILYITGRGIGGTYLATIAADGSVAMGPTATTGSGGSYWFAMSP